MTLTDEDRMLRRAIVAAQPEACGLAARLAVFAAHRAHAPQEATRVVEGAQGAVVHRPAT